MPPDYVIRYRCGRDCDATALIVEDGQGVAYLFSDGSLQSSLHGAQAPARLARLMGQLGIWAPVPEVPPYTLEGLRRIAGRPSASGVDEVTWITAGTSGKARQAAR